MAVVGTQYYALFIIGHDGFHRRLFAKRSNNDLFSDLFIYAPIGVITRINNKNHLMHHSSLASPTDPDRHKYTCFNKTSPGEVAIYLSGLRSVFNTLRNVYSNKSTRGPATQPAAGGGVGPDEADSPKDGYKPRDFCILVVWQVALIAGLSLLVGWWAYPVLWLLPVFLFAYLGDNFRSFAEHSQPEADSLADAHRMISYDPNWLERTLFSPLNMNFHAAHHLWPSIPYYNLPIADRELRGLPAATGLEWRRSYFSYLARYLRSLPIPGCDKKSGAAVP